MQKTVKSLHAWKKKVTVQYHFMMVSQKSNITWVVINLGHLSYFNKSLYEPLVAFCTIKAIQNMFADSLKSQ